MTMPLILVLVMAVLYACGIFLLLDRSLTRVLLGFLLVGNATNLLIFLMSGTFGVSPIVTDGVSADEMSDPLPQAFILTAIVITFGVSAFFLALIYRSWRLANADTVLDNPQEAEDEEAEVLSGDEITDEDVEESSDFEEDDDDNDEGIPGIPQGTAPGPVPLSGVPGSRSLRGQERTSTGILPIVSPEEKSPERTLSGEQHEQPASQQNEEGQK